MFNAANLCPASKRVVDVLERTSREIDRDPSPANRAPLGAAREQTRRAIAEALRVTADEIVITRNTSEANNLVSSGLALGANDEVLIFADNHPSNHNAWMEKSKRVGFTVTTLPQPSPHPGFDYYVDAVRKAITPRTRVLALTHVTSTVGDVMPAAELCRLARERGCCRSSTAPSPSACSTSISRRCSPTSIPAARTSGPAARARLVCCS
jgi:selenocysteine lyase/cysteine desulfurase